MAPPSGEGEPWSFQTLYSFRNNPNGEFPAAGVIIAKDGALYGTTEGGGPYTFSGGLFNGNFGTVFEIQPRSSSGGTRTSRRLRRSPITIN
jgi:hypothetical protein